MSANSLTTFLNIKFGQKHLLEQLLKEIGNPLKENNPYLCFGPQTHFARLVIVPGNDKNVIYPGQEPREPDNTPETRHYRLMFNAVFDGDTRRFVDDMVAASPDLHTVFSYCEGYTDLPHLYETLTDRRHLRASQIFYDTFPGETTNTIRARSRFRENVENLLDQYLPDVDAAMTKILQLSPINAPLPGYDRNTALQSLAVTVLVAVLGLAAITIILWSITPLLAVVLLAVVAAIAIWVLSLLNNGLRPSVYGAVNDQVAEHDESTRSPEDYYPVSMLTGREDVVVQNQFNLYLTFKGGWLERHLRLWLMMILMYILGKTSQFTGVPGSLAGLTTVHFGQWVLIDGGRRLFFITNYDGSWENYIADFVNKIYQLLDVQLIHFVGFSSEGTRNIAAFRRWLRRVQIQSDVFYSGYPFLTVRNMTRSLRITSTVPRDLTDIAARDAWLKLIGSPQFNRPATVPSENLTTIGPVLTQAEWNDIQAFIVYGYGRFPYGRYLFLNINDPEKMKQWLTSVIPLTTTVDQWDNDEMARKMTLAFNLAFTSSALEKLNVPDETLKTFSREFREGIAPEPKGKPGEKDPLHPRSIILGDTGDSSPWNWSVGNPGDLKTEREVHILLMFSALSDTVVDNFLKSPVFAAMLNGSAGVSVCFTEQGWMPHNTGREAFGFQDGISNPWVEGTRYSIRRADGSHNEPLKITDKSIVKEGKHEKREIRLDYDRVVHTGEFILGYPNEYHQLPLTPLAWDDHSDLLKPFTDSNAPANLQGVKDLGRNGSYLVYRKLQQDVAEFWGYIAGQVDRLPDGSPDPHAMLKIAAKMVGRWPSGVPLVLSPDHDDEELAARAKGNNSILNNFHYRMAGELNDEQGLHCPFGSHLRRGNPRNSLIDDYPGESVHNSNLHRIMRRAVAFGKLPDHQIDPDYFKKHGAPLTITYDQSTYAPDPDGVGIHFFGVNTSIQQQFEFIQQAWNNNAHFNGMYENKDPLGGDNVGEMPEPERVASFAKYAEKDVDQARLQTGSMTIPELPARRRLNDIPRFVNVKGGAYLFLPSIRALKYFAQCPPKQPISEQSVP